MPVDTEERKAHWRPQVEAWQASGLSAKRFCKDNALPYWQFLYWAKKLYPPKPPTAPANAFTRVMPIASPGAAQGLQITLPNGVRISGIDSDNVALLATVLDQL